jgi:hypothetical protein
VLGHAFTFSLSDFGSVPLMDSGHTWSEIGNVWILTLYGFVEYTYKQNVEGIFYQ